MQSPHFSAMKICPTCKRTYNDETYTFCLEDGSLLSTSYDPEATLVRGEPVNDLLNPTVRMYDPSQRAVPYDMSRTMRFEDLLMVKFYVVDGISYPACETAVGLFDHHGYQAMKLCRNLGFQSAAAKKSLTLSEYQELLNKKRAYPPSITSPDALNIKPLEYYLKHGGFGITASASEISLARCYLVDGLTYPKAEEMLGLHRKKGFEAMYAVCKLGAFRGATDRKSMSNSNFDARMKLLGLT